METTQRSHRVHFSASCVVRVTYGNMDGCIIMKNCILRKDIFCYKSVDFFFCSFYYSVLQWIITLLELFIFHYYIDINSRRLR